MCQNRNEKSRKLHGKRELKGKGGAEFLCKSQISSLIWKIRSKICFGLAFQVRPFIKGMQFFCSNCVKFSSVLNGTKINLILCILWELEPFEVFKVDKSEKVPHVQ